MERAEKIGLGVATAGHVMLFGLLSLNLIWSEDKPKLGDPTIAVTIAGEIGSSEILSDIPLPIATPEPAEVEDIPEQAAPAEELVEAPPEKTAPTPQPRQAKTLPPDRSAELARQRDVERRKKRETEAKREREADAKRQRETAAKRKRDAKAKATRDAAASKRRAAIANAVNAANSGPPAKSPGQIKGEVNVAIGRQIRPFLAGCTPNGIDVRSITTRVTLALNKDGSLTGISGVRQTGLNDNNRPQSGPMETCVLSAIRRAAPFSGLDQEYYNICRNHKMAFRGT